MTETRRITMTEKSAKPAAKPAAKRARSTKPRTTRRTPDHGQIAERAYFIHVESGEPDEFGNWLRAERELTAA
jgi:Protein of unknown function (DUF2934)